MTFSQKVKNELCKDIDQTLPMLKAESYGTILFSKNFSLDEITIKTESIFIAEKMASNIAILLGLFLEIRTKTYAKGIDSKKSKYSLICIEEKRDREDIFELFSHPINQDLININVKNMKDEECNKAFLRGAFLSCGFIGDPSKSYRLEFKLQHELLSKDFCNFLENLKYISLNPKITKRKTDYIVYIKNSEEIIDLLTYMGATNCALELIDIKLYKEIRNDTNRRINFDTANINKMVDASTSQIVAINHLKSSKKFSSLGDDLKEIAIARVKNPDVSLNGLCEVLDNKYSRSTLNRKLKKLVDMGSSE